MFSVIFEVLPRKENWDDYLSLAETYAQIGKASSALTEYVSLAAAFRAASGPSFHSPEDQRYKRALRASAIESGRF